MDLKLAVTEKVQDCFSKAEIYFQQKLARPEISFGIRGQDAGRAYFPIARYSRLQKPAELRFNELLLKQEPDDFIRHVVPHECAHVIAYLIFGTAIKPHGQEWKNIMEGLFGLEPRVRHNFDVSALVNKPFMYRCACENLVALGLRQHKNAQSLRPRCSKDK